MSYCSDHLGPYQAVFIYPYDVKKHRSSCIIFSLQNQIRILHFPICVIKEFGFPIFYSEWFGSRLVPEMDCFKRMKKGRILKGFKTFLTI